MSYELNIVTNLSPAVVEALAIPASPALYIYDSDPRISPQRVFKDSRGNWIQEGNGFPGLGSDPIDLPDDLGDGVNVGFLNAEYNGPELTKINRAMAGIGVNFHGTVEEAERQNARYLIHRLRRIGSLCGVVGAYNWFPRETDRPCRRTVLNHLDIWCPSLYVRQNSDDPKWPMDKSYDRDYPPRPIIPFVMLASASGEMLGQTSWYKVFAMCQFYDIRALMLWGVETELAYARTAGQFMRNGARLARVSLVPKTPGDTDDKIKVME